MENLKLIIIKKALPEVINFAIMYLKYFKYTQSPSSPNGFHKVLLKNAHLMLIYNKYL